MKREKQNAHTCFNLGSSLPYLVRITVIAIRVKRQNVDTYLTCLLDFAAFGLSLNGLGRATVDGSKAASDVSPVFSATTAFFLRFRIRLRLFWVETPSTVETDAVSHEMNESPDANSDSSLSGTTQDLSGVTGSPAGPFAWWSLGVTNTKSSFILLEAALNRRSVSAATSALADNRRTSFFGWTLSEQENQAN